MTDNHYKDSWDLYMSHSSSFIDDYQYYLNFALNYRTLDLFAGYGRITNMLSRNGIDVEAVELSKDFANHIELPQHKIHVTDVLNFAPDRRYQRIIAAYNSFCLLLTDEHIFQFFRMLDRVTEPEGVISLSYYHPDAWNQASGHEFSFREKTFKYQPGFDLSNRHLKCGVWIDYYFHQGIEKIFTYPTRIYENKDEIAKYLKGTDLVLSEEIKNYNLQDSSEPGWVEFVFKKSPRI